MKELLKSDHICYKSCHKHKVASFICDTLYPATRCKSHRSYVVCSKLFILFNIFYSFNQLNRGIWRSSISLNTKIQLYRVCIQPILLYGSETWATTKSLQDMIDAFDNYCLRRILRISYVQRPHHQCHCSTSLGFSSQTVAACPNKTTPLLWSCGEDGSLTRH